VIGSIEFAPGVVDATADMKHFSLFVVMLIRLFEMSFEKTFFSLVEDRERLFPVL
tara:strand:- start:65 stop:229 length:165 start_codon:yes stop_codon:yes gene_type:complete